MIFSNTAISVVIAANPMKRKNSAPQSLPPLIFAKMFGRVTNSRPGPDPGFTPYAKHAGKMISPAMSATEVSRAMTRIASPVSDCFLDVYEPKIVIPPIPMLSVKKAWLIAAKIISESPASDALSISGTR